jgi:hypothetical protein
VIDTTVVDRVLLPDGWHQVPAAPWTPATTEEHMIVTDEVWTAHYKQGTDERPTGIRYRSVVAWSEEGDALVVDERLGCLVPARSIPGFQRVDQGHWHGARNLSRIVAAIPGGGWTAELRTSDDTDGTNTWAEPIVAWAIDAEGQMYPLAVTSDGETGLIDEGCSIVRMIPPGEAKQAEPAQVAAQAREDRQVAQAVRTAAETHDITAEAGR